MNDEEIARAIRSLPVADHAPGFWDELEAKLAAPPLAAARRPTEASPRIEPATTAGAEAVPAQLYGHDSPTRRVWLRPVGVAAAAVLLVAIVVGANRLTAPDPGSTHPTPPATTPTTVAPDPEEAGAMSAVRSFVEALARGDIIGASNLVGPLSEAYLTATAGSVDAFLRDAEAGYGVWATVPDRTISAYTVRPGDVVVVLKGTTTTEGSTRLRALAIPTRHAESADAWFVEPWAFDPAVGGTIDLLSPDPAPDVPVLAVGQSIEVGLPADGSTWLGLGTRPLAAVTPTTGPQGRTASWVATAGASGPQALVAVFESAGTYSALARIVDLRTG